MPLSNSIEKYTAILNNKTKTCITATDKAKSVFNSVKTILFVVGGFGLVGVAWAAIWGKINWKWFGALAVGLAIVAAAASIIEYATGDNKGLSSSVDTFGNV